MGKSRCRKPPKRPSPRPRPVDDELVELARVLDERRLDNTAEGWFEPPWRDGWNAVGLATTLATGGEVHKHLVEWCRARCTEPEAYWRASEFLESRQLLETERAALRCFQVLASNSDGGGTVYNHILRLSFQRNGHELSYETLLKIEEIVAMWRCQDAIGTQLQLQGDAHDRVRRAFKIAWSRGLYRAAYALPRIDQDPKGNR